MVAAAGLRQWGWGTAAAVAAGFIAALALHGSRPEPGLARFEAMGPLADWPLQQVAAVEIDAGARHRSFRRGADGRWQDEGSGEPAGVGANQRIETGLTLLHNSGPQRTDLAPEDLAEFGLAPPRLTVTAHGAGGRTRSIAFGGANPLGLERYAKVSGNADIVLLPGFVAAEWETIVAEGR